MKSQADGLADVAVQSQPRTTWLPNRERLRFWAARISHFGAWQLASQGIQLITGFLLVRWLSLEAYAQFGVALGFQSMLNMLVDLGFSGSIVALVGERIHDRENVGRYIRSALSLRTRMLLTVGPLSALAFFWLAHRHHWPLWTSLPLFVSILASLFFQGWTACYTPPLLMHHQIGPLYRPGVLLNAAKLAACALLHLFATLGATAICGLNALASMLTGFLYRSSATRYYTTHNLPDKEASQAIRRYISPLLLGIVFYAFQGQVQVFLISIFGKTQSIAEVAALGRLGQLFMFLSAFNTTILTPFIARVPSAQLALRYTQAMLLTVTVAATVSISAFLLPGPFLWLLGPKYETLHTELSLSVTASSLSLITGTLYSFNNARQWIFHWTGLVTIGGLLLIQATMLAVMKLDTTLNVMLFAVISAAYPILPFGATALYGYSKTTAARTGLTA